MKKFVTKKCEDCFHYEACGYHITEETDMSVEECANGFKDADNVVEVVRCRECAYAGKDIMNDDMYGCSFYRDMRKGSDFCNYGTRGKH